MLRQPHHDGSALYVPQQAPVLGERVPLAVRVPAGTAVGRVQVRFVSDGEPRFVDASVDRQDTRGDTWWLAEAPARHPVTRYRFLLDTPAGERWLTAAGVVAYDVPDATDFRLVTYAAPPAWAADAVVYEIFPDRFARSAAAADRDLPDWAIPCDWDTPVIGKGPEAPYQLYGGDIDGIVERLDHIAALGANAIYLTPIFPARSNHRYDAASFSAVDPLLGGEAALRRLAAAVHARGWRLLGDITSNHTGEAHPWFTAGHRAASGPRGRQSDVDVPEREMYYFGDDGDYEGWWGIKTLPKLNWGSAELVRRFTEGPDSVVQRWLRPPYGLDGWRVDVANMTGRLGADDYTTRVAALLRAAAVEARADALIVAEHFHDYSADLDADGWHGAMNYAGFTRPVWSWLRGGDPASRRFLAASGGMPSRDGLATLATLRAFSAMVSWRSYAHSWQLLGSHDTARVRTVLGDPARVEVAAGLLMTLPGTPMVFAGDELGLTGDNGEASRTPMPWHRPESWDAGTLACYRELIGFRHREPALRHGGLRWAYADADALAFLRETAGESLLVLARRAPGQPVRLPGLPAGDNVYGGAPPLRPDAGGAVVLPADGPTFQAWRLT
ncbi:MAG TPA: alpha-amylase family glycosyl hydrolase [Pilimelia sp.]|nr:alpha-amylase family glycosyl hydrolase [Pilimelia sp.]